jgi:hypothetical protein
MSEAILCWDEDEKYFSLHSSKFDNHNYKVLLCSSNEDESNVKVDKPVLSSKGLPTWLILVNPWLIPPTWLIPSTGETSRLTCRSQNSEYLWEAACTANELILVFKPKLD